MNGKVKKILFVILGLILLAGIIMLMVVGFNKSIMYRKGTKIEIKIDTGYEKQEIETIAKETFSNRELLVEAVEKTNQVVSIKLDNYTTEELTTLKEKIAEKYGIKKDELTVEEVEVPDTRISTLVKPYLLPVTLSTILSAIYLGIKNIKSKKAIFVMTKLILTLMVVAGIYFSVILIGRIPVTSAMMPLALTIYIATLLLTAISLSKEIEKEA